MNASAAIAIALLAVAVHGTPAAAQEPRLEDVLARAAAYATRFQEQLSGIVAEETYTQKVDARKTRSFTLTQRLLRSDLLLVRLAGADRYVEFRDVFEVDGLSVRFREERLTTLFLNPPPGADAQLRRVIEESARYNIGNFTRTMNTPLLTASFLLPSYQKRFAFARRGTEGADIWVIHFKERAKPTLIRNLRGENLPTEGRFWINSATGAVTRTELLVKQGGFKAVVGVAYRLEPTLGFLVPSEMREVYEARDDHRVEGHAEYGRFRTFQVKVDETLKPVKQ